MNAEGVYPLIILFTMVEIPIDSRSKILTLELK